eukprot:scaffold500141_cov51-Attheya_sp.AAC.1
MRGHGYLKDVRVERVSPGANGDLWWGSAQLVNEALHVGLVVRLAHLAGVREAFVEAEPGVRLGARLEVVVGLHPSRVVLGLAQLHEVKVADAPHDLQVLLALLGGHGLHQLLVRHDLHLLHKAVLSRPRLDHDGGGVVGVHHLARQRVDAGR